VSPWRRTTTRPPCSPARTKQARLVAAEMASVRRSTAPRGVATIARRRPVGSAPLAGCLSLGRGPPVGCLCLLTLLGTSARPLSCSAGGIGPALGAVGSRPPSWCGPAACSLATEGARRSIGAEPASRSSTPFSGLGSVGWLAPLVGSPHGRSGCCSHTRPVGPTATRPLARLRVHRRSEDLAAAGCGARFDGRPLAPDPAARRVGVRTGHPSQVLAGSPGSGRGRVRGWM
jgi:hypothetical protein